MCGNSGVPATRIVRKLDGNRAALCTPTPPRCKSPAHDTRGRRIRRCSRMRYSRAIASRGPDRAAASDENRPMSATDQDHPLLYQVVYCSSAAPGVDDATVAGIIEHAQARNAERGITGMLVFGNGIFFQWIEGPRDTMTVLLAKLKADPRHENFVTLSETEETRERLFPDWGMQPVSGAEIHDVLLDALGTVTDARNAETLDRMLDHIDSGALKHLGQS